MAKKMPDRIVTVVEAIHNGLTKNYTYYSADKLEESAGTWNDPYNKPVLKDHNTWSGDPRGRVIKQEFKKSVINPEKFTIQLHLEITDPDTIEKVLDGRYHTLSIGGSTDSCTCSICGKDLMKEGYCGHWKGNTYEGKQAHWTVGKMDFEEISFVNVPADANAQVIIRDVNSDNGGRNNESKGGGTGMDPKALDDLDKLTEGAGSTEDPGKQQEEKEPETTPGAQQEGKENPPTVEELQVQLKESQDKLTQAQTRVTELEGEVKGLSESKKTLEEENKKQFQQNVELATQAKRILAESVIDLRVMLGKEKAEDRENLVTEYAKSSAKVLAKQVDELRQERPVRESAHVSNPGLAAQNDPHAQTEGEFTEGKEEGSLLDKFENLIIEALTKKH